MNRINKFIKTHPIIFGTLFFGVLSLVLNTVWILMFQMAHIYDIVHIFPTVLIMDPILELAGGSIPTQFVLVPIGVIFDMIIGAIITGIIWKITKKEKTYFTALILAFAVYWIVITYQWLPIFG